MSLLALVPPALIIAAIYGMILRMDHLRCMEKRKAMFMENIKREVPVEAYWQPLWTFYVPARFRPKQFR